MTIGWRDSFIGAKKSTQTLFVQSFSTTPSGHGSPPPKIMDVRTKKVRSPAGPVVGRNFLTPGHPGVRVRNVRGKSGPKSLCLCCFFFPDFSQIFQESSGASGGCLHGGASFKVEEAHFTAGKKGPENRRNEVKLRPPLCHPPETLYERRGRLQGGVAQSILAETIAK